MKKIVMYKFEIDAPYTSWVHRHMFSNESLFIMLTLYGTGLVNDERVDFCNGKSGMDND